MELTLVTIAIGIFIAAILYSSVGHAGASGYIAVMALAGLAPESLKPAALTLNILVASVASVKFYRANAFSWNLLWPLVITSIPCAYMGGTFSLPNKLYEPLLGIVLIYSAFHAFYTAKTAPLQVIKFPSRLILMMTGSLIGFLSGLIGVGGGIFLSPVLLFLKWGETRVVSGVAAAFILVNSIAGLIGTMTKNPELPQGILWWAMAAIIGGWIGADYGSKRLGGTGIRQVLALVLLVAGAKLVF